MINPSDDHTLNACLARVIGKEVEPITKVRLFERFYEPGSTACSSVKWDRQEVMVGYWMKGTKTEWNPLQNASQLDEVEAWLVEQGYSIDYHKWAHKKEYHFNIYHPKNSVTIQGWQAEDPDKKRAFALAIYAMEQGNP